MVKFVKISEKPTRGEYEIPAEKQSCCFDFPIFRYSPPTSVHTVTAVWIGCLPFGVISQ